MAEFIPSSSASAGTVTTHLNGANEDGITEERDLERGHAAGDGNMAAGAQQQAAGAGNVEAGAGQQAAAQPADGGNVEVGAGQQPQVGAGQQGGQQAAPISRMTPLYHAIFLGNSNTAQMITEAHVEHLSNCGPYGQNILHVAALRSKDLTREVLARLDDQEINRPDDHGNTPLHYAASVGVKGVTSLLVARDPNMKSTRDRNNMFPIHIAASVGAMDAIRALVSGNENDPSAALLDGNGGTFLHVAVKNRQTDVVKFVCRGNTFRNILNTRDNDGNTALHLAVQNRDESNFSHLMGNRNVQFNQVNNKGYTPLDLASKIKMQNSFASLQNPTEWMIRVLAHSGAQFSARRRDWRFETPPENAQAEHPSQATEGVSGATQKKHAGLAAASTESVLVASALIATVTFAAAFTVPGSYKTDGDPRAGAPALGRSYGFKVFLVADLLAFFCSVVATFSLAAYGTQWNVDPLVRCIYARRAVWFFHVALKSVIVAFTLGVSVVMWDVSVVAIIIVGAAALALVLYGNEALAHDLRLVRVMWWRFGVTRSWKLHASTSSHLDWNTRWLRSFTATVAWNVIDLSWTYILIYLLAYFAQLKVKGGH